MWEIYPFLQKIIAGTWNSGDLWESYGYSHRLFIPRLLFIADHDYFSANNHFLIFVSIVCQILICAVFALLLWRENTLSLLEKYGLIAIVVSLQFSGTLLFNFMHTFDVQWFICCLFIVLAFYHLSVFPSSEKYFLYGFLNSGFFIILACLCNFSAMAAWPIWIALVVLKINNKNHKITLAFVAILFISLYVVGIRSAPVAQENIFEWLKYFSYIFVMFPFVYLSNPLSDIEFFPIGYMAAFLVIPALYFLIKFWWDFLVHDVIQRERRLGFFLACLGLFGYGVALITAIGRGYDPINVHAMRYQNIVLLFWSAVISLALLEARRLANTLKQLSRVPFVMVFAGFLWCQPLSWDQNIRLGYQVNRAHLALMMGFSDNVPMIAPTVSRPMIYVPGYNLERERALYEKARKGIYQGDLANVWLDGVFLANIQKDCQRISWTLSPYKGSFTSYTSFSVSGQTQDFKAAALVNQDGKVMAMAIPERANNIVSALLYSWGLRSAPMRGFAVSSGNPFALVMLGSDECRVAAFSKLESLVK